MLLAGCYKLRNQMDHREIAGDIARKTASFPGLETLVLTTDEELTLYAIARPAHDPKIISWTSQGGDRFWLIGDLNYAVNPPFDYAHVTTLKELVLAGIPGRWVAIHRNISTGVCRIATDRLGTSWLYLGRMQDGYAWSNDFSALAEVMPKPLTVDHETAWAEMAFGSTPDNRTVFKEISIAPPGAVIELCAGGIETVYTRPVEYGDAYCAVSETKKFNKLDEICERIYTSYFKPHSEGLLLSLSGGYDSRYGFAMMLGHDIAPPLCTFGNPKSAEALAAGAIAAKAAFSTDVFSFERGDWDQWAKMIKMLGNAGTIQWCGWAQSWGEFLRRHGKAVATGYLGDALSGKRIDYYSPGRDKWLPRWMDQFANWPLSEEAARPSFVRPSTVSDLRESLQERFEAALAGATYALPHQRAHHLNMYGRQRRHSASQINVLTRFLTPVPFLYQDDLLDFWANVPHQDLIGQRLYLRYAQSRFPTLFRRGEGKPVSFARRAYRKVKRMVSGGHEAPKPPVIDRLTIIRPNIDQILALADRVSPLVSEHIDIEAFRDAVMRCGQDKTARPLSIIAAVNVFLLLELGCG